MSEISHQSITIAHLSDPHLTSLKGVQWRQLMNKRILGYLSWLKRRRFIHRPEILDVLSRDLQATKPDHIVVTGDLTHIGLQDEFRQSRRWLESLGSSEKVTVIPGNHDAYVALPWQHGYLHWEPYMVSDVMDTDDIFPSVRRRGSVAIIGLCSAIPSAPFFAVGKVSQKQLDTLAVLLKGLKKEALFRIVMLHHPPVCGVEKQRKRLMNIEAFHEVIKMHGAELVLHGHGHSANENTIAGPDGPVPVIGAASASSIGSKRGKQAGYNLYEISRQGDKWVLGITFREYRADKKRFVYRGGRELVVS